MDGAEELCHDNADNYERKNPADDDHYRQLKNKMFKMIDTSDQKRS